MVNDGECGNCRWYDHDNAAHDRAECRRSPPRPGWRLGENGTNFSEGSWPMVWQQDWCGEFQQGERR